MEKFTYLVVVNILLIKDDQILLTRRFNTGFNDGMYEPPSGHADGNETIIEASIREAKEEIGIEIEPNDLKIVHVMHRFGKKERIEFFVEASEWKGDPKICEPDECDDMKWFPINFLPENIIPKSKAGIELSIQKVMYSEFGWEERV